MLKRECRLRKQKDFDRVFSAQGRFFAQGPLALKVVANGLPTSRVGFIVSNRVSKSAVRRNRTKRLLREAVRLSWERVRSGADIAFMARTDLSDQKLASVAPAVDSLLKKSGLLVSK